MKRLFLILLCLLIFCGIADARMNPWVAGSVVTSSCSEKDGQKTYNNYCSFEDSSRKYWHNNFTPTTSYTAKTLYVRLKKDANTTYSPNYAMTAYICDDSGGHPTSCTTSDNTVLANSIAYADWGWYKFQFSAGVNLTTDVHHIQVMAEDLSTYNILWAMNYDVGHSSDWRNYYSADGINWTMSGSNGNQFMFYLTECAE